METEVKITGEGTVIGPSEIILDTSNKIGFDPKKTQDAKFDAVDEEGGIIVPRKKEKKENGGVILSGFAVSYWLNGQMVTTECIQNFDTVDDAMVTVISSKMCYVLVEGHGIKLCQIASGAPKISVENKESMIYIDGAWKRI
jgi:hypothetical protein